MKTQEVQALHDRIAKLEAELVAEAARTAKQKLRADQISKQHDMQCAMHKEAVERAMRAEAQLAAAQRGVLQAEVPYDDCLNDLAWDMHDFLTKNGAAFDGRVFNNIKQFLKECIEKWLATHHTQQRLDAQDAARYRWLREQPDDCSTPRIDICSWTCEDGDNVNTGEGLRLEAADKAIDAAIAAQAKQGEQAND